MEVVVTKGIKVPRELMEVLQKHGSISKIVEQNLIVEFHSRIVLQSLQPMLLYTHKLAGYPEIAYVEKSFSDVYTKQTGGDATRTYLKGLREIAQLSRVNFETMHGEMLTEMSSAVLPSGADVHQNPEKLIVQGQPEKETVSSEKSEPRSVETSSVNGSILTSPTVMNPPDVQRLVVEHVVRTEDASSQVFATIRLQAFSGSFPRPVNEIEYDSWRTSGDFILKDPTISTFHGSRKIIESLLPQASDIVKHLGPEASLSEYLQLLCSAFRTVEDGDELLDKFMNTLQNAGEKPLVYLSRLQAALTVAFQRNGVLSSESDRHLLRQFCRGCWDNNLIADLGLQK